MKRLVTVAVLLVCAALLGGCNTIPNAGGSGNLGINVQEMTADQIEKTVPLVKANQEKDSYASCRRFPTPYGVATIIEINSNTAGRQRGKTTMQPDCTTTMEHDSMPAASPAAQPVPIR